MVIPGQRPCEGCGTPFDIGPRERNRRRWCSESCRVSTFYRRNPQPPTQPRPPSPRACAECGSVFLGVGKRRLCSDACARARKNAKARDSYRQRDASRPTCLVADCGRVVDSRYSRLRLCAAHYKKQNREKNGRPREVQAWDDARRDAWQRRRALKKAAGTSELPVLRDEIAARDNFVCGICTKTVVMTLAWPHPDSPSLDHIVPLSRGGAHAPENVQLSHLHCNVSKGNRIERAS